MTDWDYCYPIVKSKYYSQNTAKHIRKDVSVISFNHSHVFKIEYQQFHTNNPSSAIQDISSKRTKVVLDIEKQAQPTS